jgi:hypothetical protein
VMPTPVSSGNISPTIVLRWLIALMGRLTALSTVNLVLGTDNLLPVFGSVW